MYALTGIALITLPWSPLKVFAIGSVAACLSFLAVSKNPKNRIQYEKQSYD